MSTIQAPVGLLARRLDRLKTGGQPGAPSPTSQRPNHADALARSLGGGVVDSVVVLDTSLPLSIDATLLARLPYPIEAGRPLVCLDLETTGLGTGAGTVPFLIGLGFFDESGLTVRQMLLPDHADERALLDVLSKVIPPDAWLVTYNGRTFDWPLLVTRFRLYRRDPPPLAGHLDLLPVARQLWKHRTGSARLATIEDVVCAVVRKDDLPGAFVPERYFGYLRTREAEGLRQVVEHNRQDIVSLGLLLSVLARDFACSDGWPRAHPGDLAGLARGYARRGAFVDALKCVEGALAHRAWSVGVVQGAPLRRYLATEKARLLARAGRKEDAHAAWLEIGRGGGPGAADAWLHVARYREHRLRDLAGAIDACHEAASVADRARAWGRPMHDVERDLSRRMARLRRRSLASRRFRTVSRAA
jgi:uncharacterized protein YprB with RNaseH-like and TPR domain